MEQNKYLGVYIAAEKATVVLAAKTADGVEVLDYFCVEPEAQEQGQQQGQKFSFAPAAAKIAAICAEKQFVFSDVAVAVDCRLYRQQKLHSEFQDYRQIAQTVRFDAEEALAVDASQTAIAFEVIGKQLSGSEVAAFAAGADVMSEIITALQNNKLDPVIIEPDSICLRRIVEGFSEGAIVAAVSQTRCFLICSPGADSKAFVRSFLTSPAQNKTALFAREIMLTMTAFSADRRAETIKIYDTTGQVDFKTLGEQTGMTVEALDLTGKTALQPKEDSKQDSEYLEMVIAAGAAAGLAGKTEKVDFRAEFMPYQGKKAAFEKTIKIVSISLLALFVVLGVLLQMSYYRINKDRSRLEEQFKKEYIIAMPGAKFPKTKEAVRKLKSEINRIRDVKSGLLSASGEDSVEAKLTFLFETLNSVPKNVDIEIDKIAVTTKTMNITGSTNTGGYLQLFGAIDKHPKLLRGNSAYNPKDGRDNFRLTIEIEQAR
ncbi:MAG: hypothetical protein WC496_08665 [Phycisphaerae bacterium]